MTETIKIRMEVDSSQAQSAMKNMRKETSQTKDATQDYTQALHRISPALGALFETVKKAKVAMSAFSNTMRAEWTDRTRKMANNFYELHGSLKGIGKETKSVTAGIHGAINALSSGMASVFATMNPVILALVAVGAAIMLVKKSWDVAKNSFKAFDPVGYAKLFGTMERMLRRVRTQIGYLSAGPLKVIMATLIGMLSVIEDVLDVVIEVDKWIKSIQADIGPIADILGNLIRNAGPGMMLLSYLFDVGSNKLEEAAEMLNDAVSAGLAGFDKLNNFKIEEGDPEKIAEINNGIEEQGDLLSDVTDTLGGAWENIRGVSEDVFGFWGDNYALTASWIGTLTDGIGDVFGELTDQVGSFWDSFSNSAGSAWGGLTDAVGSWAGSVGSSLAGIWDGFTSTASNVINSVSSSLGSMINGATSGLKSVVNSVSSTVKNVVDKGSQAVSSVASAISGAISGGVSTVKNLVGGLADAVTSNSAVKTVTDTAGSLKAGFDNWASDPLGETQKTVSKVIDNIANILGFAQGGVFPPNTPQLAVLGDNKTEPEIAAPYSMIVKAVQEAIGASGGTTAGEKVITINVPLEIDGRQVARASYDYIENERIRRNRSGAI